jgi:hypothetical protein
MLAGGCYLDIAFGYNVSTKSVYNVFHKICIAIDTVYNGPVDGCCTMAFTFLEMYNGFHFSAASEKTAE